MTSKVRVGVEVERAAGLDPDGVHVVAIGPVRREPAEAERSLGYDQPPTSGAVVAVVRDGAG